MCISIFFLQLCQLVSCNDNHAKTYDKWVFFTTNYDNTLEEYWVNYRNYLYLDLGFDTDRENKRKIMFPDRLIEINKNNSNSSMQLIKLHGSLNWIRNSQNQIEEHEYNLNIDNVKNRSGSKDFDDDIIIYPLS